MGTTGNRTDPPEVSEERERQAWLLRSQGRSQASIAVELGVSQQAVSKMLNKTGRKLATEFKNRVEVLKAEHTTILEHVVEELKEQWEASKAPLIKISVKTGIQKVQAVSEATKERKTTDYVVVDLKDETTTTTEDRNADPRYMSELRGALGDIRKIWGADAPQKTEVDTKHSGQINLNAPTLQKAAEEVSAWRQEQTEKLKQQRAEREAELALENQQQE